MNEPVTMKECERHGYCYLEPVEKPPGPHPYCPFCYAEWERARAVERAAAERAQLREGLAELCHKQWSGWMEYLFDKGTFNSDGTWTMPAWATRRWRGQMQTPYAQLSEPEQESDRAEADRFLCLLKKVDK